MTLRDVAVFLERHRVELRVQLEGRGRRVDDEWIVGLYPLDRHDLPEGDDPEAWGRDSNLCRAIRQAIASFEEQEP